MRTVKLPSSQFIKDYRLPLQATAVFILVLVMMLGARLYDHRALADVLGSKTSNSGDYASLLSNDKADDLSKNDVTTEEAAKKATNSNSTSDSAPISATSPSNVPFTVSPSPPPPALVPPEEDDGNETDPPAPLFTANVESLVLESSSSNCAFINGLMQTCSKKYIFRASTKTMNGPGKVSYAWLGESPSSGEFLVGSGVIYTPVRKEINLPCNPQKNFVVQFKINSPNPSESNPLPIDHRC